MASRAKRHSAVSSSTALMCRKRKPDPIPPGVRIQPSQYRALRSKLRKSVILNVFLVLLVIAMFAITLTGKNPNILNYEQALTDQY